LNSGGSSAVSLSSVPATAVNDRLEALEAGRTRSPRRVAVKRVANDFAGRGEQPRPAALRAAGRDTKLWWQSLERLAPSRREACDGVDTDSLRPAEPTGEHDEAARFARCDQELQSLKAGRPRRLMGAVLLPDDALRALDLAQLAGDPQPAGEDPTDEPRRSGAVGLEVRTPNGARPAVQRLHRYQP